MDLARRWKLVVAEIGWPSLIVLAIATVVGIGGWIVLIVDDDPAWNEYIAIHLGTILVATTVVTTLIFLSPFSKSKEKGTRLTLLVVLSPVLLTLVVTAIITPPTLSTGGFLDFPAHGVIAMIALLGIGAMLCSLLVYLFLVYPVILLVRATRPEASRTASSALYQGMNRRELIAAIIALPTIVALAISLTNVSDDGTSKGSRGRADLLGLVTLTGNPAAIAGVLVSLVVLAAAIAFAVRSRRSA